MHNNDAPCRGRPRLFCGLLIGLALVGTATAGNKVIRLRADQWMPFNGDPAGEQPGYVVELARAIFGEHKISIDYQTMPWADALKAARVGEIEGVIGANAQEAVGLVKPEEVIGLPRVGLFTRKGNPWKFVNLQSLEAVRLGVVEGYSYWDTLDEYIKHHSAPAVVVFSGDAPLRDGMAKLDAGDIDVMAETLSVWVWNVKDSKRARDAYHIASLQSGDPIFVAFAPKDGTGAGYAAIWDAGLREFRKDGRLAAILKRYGLEDWQE